MLRFLHFEIGALDRQPRVELLSPFFEAFAETPMQLQDACHVFDLRKTRKFNEHGMTCFLSVIMVWHLRNCWQLKKAFAGMPRMQTACSQKRGSERRML